MAEQSKQDLNDRRHCKSSSNSQRTPWYLQSRENEHSFDTDSSHVQQHLYPMLHSNITEPQHQQQQPPQLSIPSPSFDQISDRDRSYGGRPGTPALPPTGMFDNFDRPADHRDDEYISRSAVDASSVFSREPPDRRILDLCQPQQPPNQTPFFAPAFSGKNTRSLELNSFEQHHHSQQDPQLSRSFTAQSQAYQHRNVQQNVGERISHPYLFHPTQTLHNSLSDLDGNPTINYNFNHLHHNMVRLRNGDDARIEQPNGENCHEDREGNHECHNLRKIKIETHEPEYNSVPCLLDTPTIGGIDFAALSASIYQGEWPMNRALWMSGPSSIGEVDSLSGLLGDDTESIMSFSSSTAIGSGRHSHPHQLGTKVGMVYSLLSMLGSSNRDDMSKTLLEMSSNKKNCIAMRQSGCLPLLVQLLHGTDHNFMLSDQDPDSLRWALREARRRAGQALHNIVYAHPDDKRGRREARVLRLLEQIRDYSDYLRDVESGAAAMPQNENLELNPGPAIAALMKLSFDEEHRHAMCLLGGLQAIAELIQVDHEAHGNTNDQFCITVRRYAGMALTNLTFGDGTNKALLCSMKSFMQALVAQLHSPNEDLRQVTASVLRNLSWRADAASKQILREINAVITLMQTAMTTNKESTLKSILSALWNLSAHCSMNKADICAIEGALEFLVSTLTYKSASKTLSIVENGGGILRNVSSHIAVKEEYRTILRRHSCLQTLLRHLKSPSLTVVSNACGTLWNLSARCQQDQQALWEMGAVGMLRNLIHSKHKMISMGSAAALKNLLAARPPGMGLGLSGYVENGHHQNGGSQNSSPSLLVRKQRALEADIDQNLSETCDNIDSPKTSPSSYIGKKFTFDNAAMNKPQYLSYLPGRMYHSINGHVTSPLYVPRSESRDSLGSTRSEPPHYKAQCDRFRIFINTNRHLPLDSRLPQEKATEWKEKTNLDEENNSSIVMQLFNSLHSSTYSSGPGNAPINRPLFSNNLTSARNSFEVPSQETEKVENRNIKIQNNCLYRNESNRRPQQIFLDDQESQPSHENQLRIVSSRCIVSSPVNSENEVVCNFPENKRPIIGGQEPQIIDMSKIAKNDISDEYCIYRNTCDDNINSTENIKTQKYSMDTIPENVILRKKTKCDISHWSSTSTLKEPDSDSTSRDHTPLAVSRCSSLSSLASCMPHSARNSWISDVSSQRTSGIISPSEIPDSPSDMKLRMSQFTDKAPDAETLGIPRPKPAWPNSINTTISSSSQNNMFYESTRTSTYEEVQLDPYEKLKSPPERPPNTPEKDVCSVSMQSTSFDGSNHQFNEEEHMNFDIPNNSSSIIQRNNNNKLHSRVNNLSSSFSYMKSGIPVKSNNVRLTQSIPNVPRPQTLSSCAIGPAVFEYNETSTESIKSGSFTHGKREYDRVCDDNDNLLIENMDHKAGGRNVLLNNFHETTQKTSKSQNAELSYHHSENTHLSPLHCDIYKNKSEKPPIVGNAESTCSTHNFQILSMSPSSDLPVSSVTGKHSRSSKTSIPQIMRPWQPNLDNEVHPKQLQIMSQNLPVYKGTFAIHQTDCHVEDENEKEEIAQAIQGHSDPSSVSADSEISSAELLQAGIVTEKPPRTKIKRNKLFRRSTEIPTPEHSSDEDNINNIGEAHILFDHVPSLQSSEGEEKGKEDERRKEKYKELLMINSNIPDLLEGATFHADIAAKKCIDSRPIVTAKMNGSSKVMTDSVELRKGAFMITAELDELVDDQTHSSTSCFSDIDNIKPPSFMGEMSMTSSGLSDLLSNGNGNGKCYINGKAAVDRRRSLKRIKKANGNHRLVFKSVLQTRDKSLPGEHADKASLAGDSIENLSMRSSGTSEILDNINPPSVMDDISMTNSCTSLNSINSDILESRSQSLADPRSDSEMFQRLNAAAAMVQVYSREFSNIMTGSMKSSCNSDNLDQVKPPSVFQDIAEVTVEDGTEVCSDAMISDSELEDNELPHDDESSIPSTATVNSPIHLLTRTEQIDGSTENLNSSVDGDSICMTDKTHHSFKRISSLALTPQSSSVISMGSNVVTHAKQNVHKISKNIGIYGITNRVNDVNETNKIQMESQTSIRRGPRIVKPINRETIRQMQEKKVTEAPIHSIRGRATNTTIKNNVIQPTNVRKSINGRKNVNSVRPTRTSALRASQSQKQADGRLSNGRISPRAFLCKPPTTRAVPKTSAQSNSNSSILSKGVSDLNTKSQAIDCQKPSPPVKQGTFTKDEPTIQAPAISPSDPQMSNCQVEQPISHDSCSEQIKNLQESTSSRDLGCKSSSSSAAVNRLGTKKSDGSSTKPNTSNYVLRRNVSLPLHKKENSRVSLKSSPSNNSLGENHDGTKVSGNVNSKSTIFSKNSICSLSSSGFSLKRANSQKEVASKISSIWKKSESSSSANSPVTDNSFAERISAASGGKSKLIAIKTCSAPNRTLGTTLQDNSMHSYSLGKSDKPRLDLSSPMSKSPFAAKGPPTSLNVVSTINHQGANSTPVTKRKFTNVRLQSVNQQNSTNKVGNLSFSSNISKNVRCQNVQRSYSLPKKNITRPQPSSSSVTDASQLYPVSSRQDHGLELKSSVLIVEPDFSPSTSDDIEHVRNGTDQYHTTSGRERGDSENSESGAENETNCIVTSV